VGNESPAQATTVVLVHAGSFFLGCGGGTKARRLAEKGTSGTTSTHPLTCEVEELYELFCSRTSLEKS